MSKIKVGDKVMVAENLKDGVKYGGVHFVSLMEKYRGKVFEILSTSDLDNSTHTSGDYFRLDAIGDWIFSSEMLELVE